MQGFTLGRKRDNLHLNLDHPFCGKVLELRDGGEMVVQKFGRDPDRVAVHKAHLLSRVPDVGEVVEIQYKAGLGQVSAREKGMEFSR